jgi:hypothetical protein
VTPVDPDPAATRLTKPAYWLAAHRQGGLAATGPQYGSGMDTLGNVVPEIRGPLICAGREPVTRHVRLTLLVYHLGARLICRSPAYGTFRYQDVPSGHAKEPLVNRYRRHPVRGHRSSRSHGLLARRYRPSRPLRGQPSPSPSHQPPGLQRDRAARIAAVPLGEPAMPGLRRHRQAGTARLTGDRDCPGTGRAPGWDCGEGQDAPEPELAVRNTGWATPGEPTALVGQRARGQQHDRDAEQRPRQPAGLALSYLRHRTLPPHSFTCASTNPTQ